MPIGNARRYRDKAHLKLVAAQPCLVCGRKPCDPHHVRFAQKRALGRKVSDEFTVPLCRTHHRALHRSGDEALWWQSAGLDPIRIARRLWRQTRLTNRGRPTRSRSLDRATAASAEPAASVGAPIPSSPALSSQPAAERP